MAKEKRYVEIEIEVECDEGDMTDEGWVDYSRLNGLYEAMGDVVKRVGNPYATPRRRMYDIK